MPNARTLLTLLLTTPVILSGCLVTHPPCAFDDDHDFYRTIAASSAPASADGGASPPPLSTEPPLLTNSTTPPPAWEMPLDEVVRTGLENSKVLRDLGGSVLRTPAIAQTIHDPAIQASDPRFGMDGALAAFDAQLSTRLLAQHNDRAFNNLFLGGGAFLFRQDLDTFDTQLSKRTATGASFSISHHIDYDANNAPANRFPSAWNTNYQGEVRQPLLQGAGLDFNRIAGPNGTPGLINGVVIARINNTASTAEFEIALRDLVSNLENAYWDLYYAYRELDARRSARDTSLSTWRIIHANVQEGRGYTKLQEVQSLEQYYRFEEDVLDALGGRVVDRTRTNNGSTGGTFRGVGGVLAAERRLRMWMGLPINDGKLIRPTDEPPQAKVVFDWCQVMGEALGRRPELRRQRAQVQRANMEVVANRNFLLPQLDVIGRYRFRGFGHDWMGSFDPNDPYTNALANLTSGQFQEWEMGFEYSMPLGFRRGYAAVRNAQLKVARERAILEEQERQAIHDLSAAVSDTQRAYSFVEIALNRVNAARDQFRRAYDGFFDLGGKVSLELVLDARIRLAEAETSYHRARIEYAIALKNVYFENGSLLEHNGAYLADHPDCSGAFAEIRQRMSTDNPAPINYVMLDKARPDEQQATPTMAEPTSQKPAKAAGASPGESSAPAVLPLLGIDEPRQIIEPAEAVTVEG